MQSEQKIQVVHQKDKKILKHRVYCGRPTPVGNPFVLKSEAERDLIADAYQKWFDSHKTDSNIKLFLEELLLKANDGLELSCYCKPKRCHCDTIANWLKQELGIRTPIKLESETEKLF